VHDIRPFLAGDWREGTTEYLVPDKFSDQPVSRVQEPGREQVTRALTALADAQADSSWPAYDRASMLSRACVLLASLRLTPPARLTGQCRP
jgi:acyl-CoA reductase-like NAD-dependent aldehyde dehydrogenase